MFGVGGWLLVVRGAAWCSVVGCGVGWGPAVVNYRGHPIHYSLRIVWRGSGIGTVALRLRLLCTNDCLVLLSDAANSRACAKQDMDGSLAEYAVLVVAALTVQIITVCGR